jgi:hypothetical protein
MNLTSRASGSTGSRRPSMDLCVEYMSDCPHWELAARRVRDAVDLSGYVNLEVRHERVTSDEDAARLHFRGSPTIKIEGHDPFTDSHGTIGMSCRTYRTEHGIEGAPSVAQLVAALARARNT